MCSNLVRSGMKQPYEPPSVCTFFIMTREEKYMREALLEARKAYEEDEDLLEDVIIENKQAREMVEMYSKILARMADTFTSIIANNQNLVMKFLAAMTIIIAIPTVVSSFFGMNVPVPFGENANGFVYVMMIALGMSLMGAVALWKRDLF